MRVISTDFRKGIAPTYKYKVAGKDKAPHGKSREVLFAHIRLWSFRAEVLENNLKDDFFLRQGYRTHLSLQQGGHSL